MISPTVLSHLLFPCFFGTSCQERRKTSQLPQWDSHLIEISFPGLDFGTSCNLQPKSLLACRSTLSKCDTHLENRSLMLEFSFKIVGTLPFDTFRMSTIYLATLLFDYWEQNLGFVGVFRRNAFFWKPAAFSVVGNVRNDLVRLESANTWQIAAFNGEELP